MSRPAFGTDGTMSLILKLVGESNRLESPVRVLADEAELGVITIKNYLIELGEKKFIELVYGGHGNNQIMYLLVLKREVPVRKEPKPLPPKKKPDFQKVPASSLTLVPVTVPVKLTPLTEVVVPPPVSIEVVIPVAPPVEVQAPVSAPLATPAVPTISVEARVPTILLIVDYDNAVSEARRQSFSISFAKLREFVLKSGKILFSEVFISPKAAQRQENVDGLWQAGFKVVSCPMGSKDADAVDAKINWTVRQYLEHTTVDIVFIVSRDQDFRELAGFARDMHKRVEFLDVLRERSSIEGEDVLRELVESRALGRFEKAVESLAGGFKDGDEQDVEFLKSIIRAFADRRDLRKISFDPLRTYIWGQIYQEWSGVFKEMDLKIALSALVHGEVIKRNLGDSLTYYTLNRDHPATRYALNH